MKASRRSIAIAAGLLAVITAVVTLGSRFTVDASAYKGLFETSASLPLGLQVRVRGPFAVAFTGRIHLVARDLRVLNSRGAEILTAERATIAVAVLPLLINQRRVHQITLMRPRLHFERDRHGVLNWAQREEPRGPIPVLAGTRLSLLGGTVRYEDAVSGTTLEATDVNANVSGIRRRGSHAASLLAGLSFRGKLRCREIKTRTVSIADVNVLAKARGGTLEFDPIAWRAFGGKGLASFRAELSDSIPRYRLRGALSGFEINECLRTLSPDTIATGAMDFSANLASNGRSPAEWSRSLDGDVILRGREIKLRGRDLDHDFARFESSQHLDLSDVGSFFFVGPLGMVATKGYDFARLIGHSDHGTHIRSIVSSWDVRGGELKANDVAMATNKNRVALRGRLDFEHQRFDSVTVAIVDKDGCAKIRQELRGTFQKPELTKPTILMSLLGPARKVVTSVKDLLPGGPCEIFYAGSVPPPE